jgi:hypothetical protein
MSYDPDFVLIVNGQDITPYLMLWHLSLPDNDSCSFQASIANQNSEFAGFFKPNNQLNFCFGYVGHLTPMISLDILTISPEYAVGKKTIKITAYDEIHKLCGQNLKGCFDRGVNTKDATEAIIKQYAPNVKPKVDVEPPNIDKKQRLMLPGYTAIGAMRRLLEMSKPKQDSLINNDYWPGPGGRPQNFYGENNIGWNSEAKQHTARIDNRNPKDPNPNKANTIDQNRNRNAQKNKNASTLTAKLSLWGCPDLKPSAGITILNVDEWSGDWYCNHVDQKWDGSDYTTDASLQRGEIAKQGKGGSGKSGKSKAPNPMVISYDPFTKEMYAGPRKTDCESQATFIYGAGQEVISFDPTITVAHKGGPEKVGSSGPLTDSVGDKIYQSYNSKGQ